MDDEHDSTQLNHALRSLRSGTMRGVPIATLSDEVLPNVMRKVIAHGLGD
jgi:A/G-specific adenine glycosylase